MRPARPVVQAWLLSRAYVVALVALGTWLQVRHGYGRAPVNRGLEGFFVWDGGWYRAIATHGYGALPTQIVRFFPLVPLLAAPFRFSPAAALLVVVSVSALAYAEGLYRLTQWELRDQGTAARAAWLALLNPTAYVMVIAYAEATAAAFAVWAFLALRRQQWWLAALLGLGAGLSRPTGLLLAIPAAVEAGRGWRHAKDWLPRLAAVAAAPLGCATYLAYIGVRFGHPLLPFSVQKDADLRGGFLSSPLTALQRAWTAALGGGRVSVSLHLVWVPLVLVLVYGVARRLPASYAWYSAAIVFLAVTTPTLTSFERYSMSAFPLLMVAAETRSRVGRVTLGAACGLGLAGYSILALTSLYVP